MEQSILTSNDLLLTLTAFISENGGRNKLIERLEMEWQRPELNRYHRWNSESVAFIIESYNRLSKERMAQILHLSVGVIDHKIRELKRQKKLSGRKKHIHLDTKPRN